MLQIGMTNRHQKHGSDLITLIKTFDRKII